LKFVVVRVDASIGLLKVALTVEVTGTLIALKPGERAVITGGGSPKVL
jgi:hypothetical protein